MKIYLLIVHFNVRVSSSSRVIALKDFPFKCSDFKLQKYLVKGLQLKFRIELPKRSKTTFQGFGRLT